MSDPHNAFADRDPAATPGSGPLSDLVIGIKSNIAVRGLPWTAGMGTRREIIAENDADVVARLRDAGAMIVGTLNMHEAALGATTDNAFYGRTHNPHRHGFTPGGSSGGSGAAVAAGLVDAALGTDTLGSIRIPAAYCGVYGLKPTLGAVSSDGLVHLGTSFDVIGPLARDLDVLERLWRALESSLPPKGGGTAAKRQGEGTERGLEAPSPSLPALAFPSPLEGEGDSIFTLANLAHVEIQPAVRAAYERTLARLPAATELTFEDTTSAIRLAALVPCIDELKAALGTARHGPLVSDELKAVIAAVEQIAPAPEILKRTRAALIDALGSDGILVMPTAPQVAFAHGTRAPANQADFTCLASVAGLPALSIPAGVGQDGLPVGVQLVGPAGSELRLIALARTLEEEAP